MYRYSRVTALTGYLIETVSFVLVALSLSSPVFAASEAEMFRKKGLDAYQSGNVSEAESLLRQALQRDSGAEGARDALDKIEKAKKDVKGSRNRARSAVGAGGSSEENEGDSAGGTSVSTENISDTYREKGRLKPGTRSSGAAISVYDGRPIERPSEYGSSSLFNRFGTGPQNFRPAAEPVAFLSRDEFIEQAYDWPDATMWNGLFRYAMTYDSNFPDVVDDATVPATLQNQGAVIHQAQLQGKVRSTPLERFWYGAELNGGIKYFARSQFQPLNLTPLGGGVVASWWNARSLDATFRYDAATSWLGQELFGYHSSAHGPHLSVAALAAPAIQVHSGYAFRRNHFRTRPGTADLAGWRASTHSFHFEVWRVPRDSIWHPYFRTMWDWNSTQLNEQRSRKKTFGVGTSLALPMIKLKGGVDFSYFEFPRAVVSRIEHRWGLHAAGEMTLSQNFSALLSILRDIQKSTISERYSFNRSVGSVALLYQL